MWHGARSSADRIQRGERERARAKPTTTMPTGWFLFSCGMQDIDPALRRPGRLGVELSVMPPSAIERGLLLRHFCRALPLAPELQLRSPLGDALSNTHPGHEVSGGRTAGSGDDAAALWPTALEQFAACDCVGYVAEIISCRTN